MADELHSGPLSVSETGGNINELVSLGCKFVVDGDVFRHIIEMIEKLMADVAQSDDAVGYLLQMRTIILNTSVPVRTKIGDESKILVPEKKIVVPQ